MTGADFRDAYERHKDLLYRFARRMTGSNEIAEDLVHECFLLLWSKRAAYHRTARSSRLAFSPCSANTVAKELFSMVREFKHLED